MFKRQQNGGEPLDGGLSKFSARYRLAKAFTSINASGLSTSALDAYGAALKIGLAYSAVEALEVAIGTFKIRDFRRQPVISRPFANALRDGQMDALRNLIVDSADREIDKQRYRDAFEEITSSHNNHDLRKIIEGIRHSVFHGSFTATASGLSTSKKRLTNFQDLAGAVFDAADREFEYWLEIYLN